MKELRIPRTTIDPNTVPDGLCGCGCGGSTQPDPRRTDGLHFRFRRGHRVNVSPKCVLYTEKPETGCWLWAGTTRRDGYPNLFVDRGVCLAHRYVYSKLVHPVGEDVELNHLCRTRYCINPAHLEPTTHVGNVRHGLQTKLTPALVSEIRQRYEAAGGRYGTLRRLAHEYGVAPSTIRAVVKRLTWQDVA
jgi:hypothetical protein